MACVRGRRNPGNSIEIIYWALTLTTPWRGCPFIRKGNWGCRYGEMRAWPVHRQRNRRQARRHACMADETQATQLKLYTGRSLKKPRGVGAIHKFKRPDPAWSHSHSLRRWPLEPEGAAGPAHSRAWGDRRCVRNAAGCAALCRGMPTHMHIRKRNWPGVIPETPQKPPAPACEPARECALFGPGSARKGQASAFALHFHVRVF